MSLLALVACICSLSLGIASTTRAQGIDCADYAPDQSGVARTILEGTGASYLLMAGDLALIGQHGVIRLVDMQDPTHPVPLPTGHPPLGYVFAIADNHAGFWILVELPGYHNGETGIAFAAHDEIGYVSNEFLMLLDGSPYAHAIGDGKIYIASRGYSPVSRENWWRLYTVDITSPGSPHTTGITAESTNVARISDLHWSNHVLWRAMGSTLIGGSTNSPPSGPSVYRVDLGAPAHRVASGVDKVFVTHAGGLIRAFEITGPTTLEERGSIRIPANIVRIWLYGDRLYASLLNDGVLTLDVGDLDDLRIRDFWPRYREVEQVVVEGEFLYLVSDLLGVQQIPLNERSLEPIPYVAKSLSTHFAPRFGALHGVPAHGAVAVGFEDTLSLERVSGFDTWERLGTIELPESIRALASRGRILYAATGGGLHAVEVADDGTLSQRGSVAYAPALTALSTYGDVLYALDPKLGILVVDLSAHDAPQLRSAVDLQHSDLRALALQGDRLLVLGSDALFTLDLGDPLDPRPLMSFPLGSPFTGMAVTTQGDLALAHASARTVTLHRFDAMSAPEPVRMLTLESEVTALHVANDVLYVGTQHDGVQAFEVSHAENASDLGHLGVPTNTSVIESTGDLLVTMATPSTAFLRFSPRVCNEVGVSTMVRDFGIRAHSQGILVRAEVEHSTRDTDMRVELRTSDTSITRYAMLPTAQFGVYETIVARPAMQALIELQVRDGAGWSTLAQQSIDAGVESSRYHLAYDEPGEHSDIAMIQFDSPVRVLDISVFDLRGRRVVQLGAGLAAGQGSLPWNRRGLARGSYFLRMHTETRDVTRKVVVWDR